MQAGELDGGAALGARAAGGGRQGVVLLEVGLRRKHVPALGTHVFPLKLKKLGCARADNRARHAQEVAHVVRPGDVVTRQLGAHREAWGRREGGRTEGKRGGGIKEEGRVNMKKSKQERNRNTGRCAGSFDKESQS